LEEYCRAHQLLLCKLSFYLTWTIRLKRCRWVVGLALLADTVPPDQLAQATGWISLGMSLGILIAPLLGGVVFDHAGYNAVFGMTYALIGLDIVLRLLLVEKKVAARWDPDASASAPVAVGNEPNETISTSTAPMAQETDPEKANPAASDHPKPNDTLYHQRRRDRLPPVLSLLYSRRLWASLVCALLQATLFTSFDSVLTIHAANIFGWTSTGAGLLFLPLVIPGFLSPLFGWLSDEYGARCFVVVGFLCACPPLVCLRFIDENSMKDKVLLCALLAITGLFLALTFPPIMAEISSVVEAKEKNMLARGHPGFGPGGAYAQAYALFNVAFAGGCMLGPLLAGFIVEGRGWPTMAWVLGLVSGIAALPAFLWLGGFFFQEKAAQ
jgi:MFS family permease